MIRAIIFDCFNVMVADATKQALEKMYQLDPEKREEFSAITHAVDKGIISDEEAISGQSALMGMSRDDFVALRNSGEVRNEELIEYARSLRGRYKIGLLSNINSRARVESRFLPGQLDSTFDVVIASGEVGYIKPQPEIFQVAAEQLDVLPEECIFIDDIAEFCEGARQVGMQSFQYQNNQQCITDLNALIDRGGKTD